MDMAGRPAGVHLDVEHALRDDPTLAGTGKARVLDGVLQIEQHARLSAGIALIDQHRAALQQVAVALQREVDDGVEQRVTGADKGGQRLALKARPATCRRRCARSAAAPVRRCRSGGRGCGGGNVTDLESDGSRCLAVPPSCLKAS
jgi:hypothetical protein